VTPKLASPIDLRDLAREERTALVAPDPPFVWTTPAEAIIYSHRRMLDRISTSVN